MRLSHLLLALSTALFTAPCFAQDAENETSVKPEDCIDGIDHLEDLNDDNWIATIACQEIVHVSTPIIVKGTLAEPMAESSYGIYSMSGASPATRLESNLWEVPGLQQFRRSDSRSANPTSQGVTLRGLGGNASSRALLFLDGVPQADPFGGWVSWPSYEASGIAARRVLSGGGQPSAGPGALAGLIELETVRGEHIEAIAASYGSQGNIESVGRYYRDVGTGWLTAGASYAKGNSFTPIIVEQRGPVDRPARYEQAALALHGTIPISDATQVQANVRAFSDSRDRGLDFSDNENGGVDGSIRIVKHSGDWQWSATGYVQVREFSSQFGAVSADRTAVTPTLDQFATPSTGLGLRFEVRPHTGDNSQVRLGGEWRRAVGETKELFTFVAGLPTRLRTAGGRTDSYGGFAEASVRPTEALTLSAGGRLDRWEIDDGFRREVTLGGAALSDASFVYRSGTEWTGRIGLAWMPTYDFTLRAAAYRGWRLPTLNELYRPFRVGADATAANENLRPEYVNGVEAGVTGWISDAELKATLFWNRLDGAITNVTLGQGPGSFPGVGFVAAGGAYRQRQNIDAIVSKGLEVDATYHLSGELRLKLTYAFTDAEMRATALAAPLNGLRPAQVPKHSGSIRLIASAIKNFYAEAALRYVGDQFEDDANSRKLDDALTADLVFAYRPSNWFEFELRGENLFDARVEAAISATGIVERASPRTVRVGVRFDFD